MEFSEVIKKRRSTRKFTGDGVSREQIIKMLEAAIMAPNACNMQSWHFYVVTDENIKKMFFQRLDFLKSVEKNKA